jgi:DNA-3-methyladenine glycosylase II
MSMHRIRVSEDSMLPTLTAGEEFVVTSSRSPVADEVVVLPHPGRTDFWLVKRLTAGPGETVPGHGVLGDGEAWVMSDNITIPTSDSRSFGPVPIETIRPRVTHLDATTFLEGVSLLAEEEPAFAQVVAEFGLPPFWSRPAGFATLVWLVMEQQVSLESGAAMVRRLVDRVGEITPDAVASLGEPGLRGIGTTRQKAGYLTELATSIVEDRFDLDAISAVPGDEARRRLLEVKGIGPWTADAYLLSAARLPDVFPVGDRALQVGVSEVLGIADPLPEPDLEFISQPWRPIRAVAARVIWHSYLSLRGRSEPADPFLQRKG